MARAMSRIEEPAYLLSIHMHELEFLCSRYGNGCRLDRIRFDAMLLDRARAAGVTVYRGLP